MTRVTTEVMPRRASPIRSRDPDIAALAGILADASRVAMLDALLDGTAHPIGVLARRAGITAATASSHLHKLIEARLVVVAPAGRERHVRLASPDVAELIERLATLAGSAATRGDQLRFARTCYDHLAGALSIRVAGALVERGWLHRTSDTFEPAPALFTWLAERDHPVPITGERRPLSRACLDWSERVPHVAGRIGAALARVFLAERWVTHIRDTRALRLTDRGRVALARELGVVVHAACTPRSRGIR